MSPDEVIEVIKNRLGVELTRSTLLRYENQELIPRPTRGGGGPGGRWTDYPLETLAEAYAAWSLLHGKFGDEVTRTIFGGKPPSLSPEGIREFRNASKAKDFFVKTILAEFKKELIKQEIPEKEHFRLCENKRRLIEENFDSKTVPEIGVINRRIVSCFADIWKNEVTYAQNKLSE
jgi:hypothetical protein